MEFGNYIDTELSTLDMPEDREQRRKIEKRQRDKRRLLEKLLGIEKRTSNPVNIPTNVMGIKVVTPHG
jgi:hypothetical protein